MYCPRCAVQNLDDAKFCRACGADIRLVPQALMGTLPGGASTMGEAEAGKKEKRRKPATLDEGLKHIFQGFGLLVIFLTGIFVFHGAFWVTIWFIIPALSSIGEGIGQLIRARHEQTHLLPPPASLTESGIVLPAGSFASANGFGELSSPDTAEMIRTPASITELTTRHLDAPLKNAAKDV